MAKAKTIVILVAGVLIVGGAAVVKYVHRESGPAMAQATVSSASSPLPALPSGWVWSATPSSPGNSEPKVSSALGSYQATGLDITTAIDCWRALMLEVDPAVAAIKERYDVSLTAPSGASQGQMNAVLQVEMQRLFKIRVAAQKLHVVNENREADLFVFTPAR